MNYTVQKIESRNIWNDFLKKCAPRTFLQSWEWGDFNKKMGERVFRFGVYYNGALIAVSLLLKIQARRGTFLFCPHGPVCFGDGKKSQAGVFEALSKQLVQTGKEENCDFIRISPLFTDNEETRTMFRALKFRNAPVHLMHPELSWILNIQKEEEDILRDMRKNTRYSIRKAKKDGVCVRSGNGGEELDAFWMLYEATFSRQKFTPFSKKYMKEELEVFGKSDMARIFLAEYEGEIISGAFVVFTENSAFYHHGASSQKFQKITASHAVLWRAIQEAKERGCAEFNFWGIVPESEKGHPWHGLSLFKRGFGGFEEKYVHAKDRVLTPKYIATYIIEKIRRYKRGL